MKTISAALRTHLASGAHTMATCWLCVRADGQIFAATNHDRDIVFNLETSMATLGLTAGPGIADTGSQVYLARTGYRISDLEASSGLNVDTGEAVGALDADSIIEDDLLSGLWDNAYVTVFEVNYADLTMGPLIERTGRIGEVQIDLGVYKAEWRGLTQAYTTNIGRIDSPFCNAVLGDARCGVNLGSADDSPSLFTHAGTLDSVSADGLTLFDAARTEPGPSGGVDITAITNADPGVVTLSDASALHNGDPVVMSGIVGPTLLNTTTVVTGLSNNSFSLGIDTSDTGIYPVYSGGGKLYPLGLSSGYFDFGKITITSGDNAGRSMEIKSYTPGQIILQLPFYYPLNGDETYTIVAGCDHSRTTCRDKFNNIVNFRGFPFLPGVDKMTQVGRHGTEVS